MDFIWCIHRVMDFIWCLCACSGVCTSCCWECLLLCFSLEGILLIQIFLHFIHIAASTDEIMGHSIQPFGQSFPFCSSSKWASRVWNTSDAPCLYLFLDTHLGINRPPLALPPTQHASYIVSQHAPVKKLIQHVTRFLVQSFQGSIYLWSSITSVLQTALQRDNLRYYPHFTLFYWTQQQRKSFRCLPCQL